MRTKILFTKSVVPHFAAMLFVALLVLTNVGCGSTRVSTHTNVTASVGQQLMDLKKAREMGLLDDKEYEQLREVIIEKNK